jgi:hypothetical protein
MENKQKNQPVVSAVLENGTLLETVYDPKEKQTAFAVWEENSYRMEEYFETDTGTKLVPYSAENNLIKNDVVLLPSFPEEYESEEQLITEIRQFIHTYVDVSPLFEQIASYYVLFSWVHDGFNELPYLRLRGDYGSGKTRFLLTIGSVCYKPIFASGASTVAPIFHILDAFHGTLLIDEADFRFSDEKAEMVKILNNGNVKGFPVLRCEVNRSGEFNPRAYHVFGPKIIATRGYYRDRALESRFITEEMGGGPLRKDIPINLPPEYKIAARTLRNKLLLFRFRNLGKNIPVEQFLDRSLAPRLNQIFAPLMSIIKDLNLRSELSTLIQQYNKEIIADRGMDVEAGVLTVIKELSQNKEEQLSVKNITQLFIERYDDEYDRKITAKWIGGIIRKKLNLKTHKSHGVFVISATDTKKLETLYAKFGIRKDAE